MDELEQILAQINELSGVALDAFRQARGAESGNGPSPEGAPPPPEEGAPVPPGQ